MKFLINLGIVALVTLSPLLELRGAIPVGIGLGLPLWIVLITVFVVNLLDAVIAFYLFKLIVFLSRKMPFFDRLYKKYVKKTQKKIRPWVDKYGIMGLALFIGIPIPGSGAYTGAIGADILGIKFKDFMLAATVGILIALTIITLLSVGGFTLFGFSVVQ